MKYFINLSDSILDSLGAHKRVQAECAMNALNVDVDTAVPLGLIVNELLTNTTKYAFPDGRSGKVQISLAQGANGDLQMHVSDNGVGKSGNIHGTGFGGQLANIKKYGAVWDAIINQGKLDLFNTTNFDKNVVFHSRPNNIVGIDSARAYYANYLTGFSHIKFTVTEISGEGDKLTKHWTFTGVHTGNFLAYPPPANRHR